ncbi:hypothetical protein O181_130151 [Austropuccinia psidii MF-1]|uniref:Uncharacterized protein n=1 Tax=Austropuccinia psidii MF-1 TaxID=1389203 RepID=A0A9Q3Q976_9BASI|nr:hypothetical protein [Austropuccinia psidii MF-1]
MLDKARHHANIFMQHSFKYAKERWDKIHKPPDFKIRDLVLVSTLDFNNIKGPKKLKDSFSGPFMIKSLHGPNAVQLELTGELMNKHPTLPLGPIGHIIPFMANWPPWVFYGIHAITPSNGHFMASGHILPSLAFLVSSHFTNPQAFTFDFGPGGVILSSRALQAPSHHPWIHGHPFHYWCFGLNGLFGPFRPPTAPTARGP